MSVVLGVSSSIDSKDVTFPLFVCVCVCVTLSWSSVSMGDGQSYACLPLLLHSRHYLSHHIQLYFSDHYSCHSLFCVGLTHTHTRPNLTVVYLVATKHLFSLGFQRSSLSVHTVLLQGPALLVELAVQ